MRKRGTWEGEGRVEGHTNPDRIRFAAWQSSKTMLSRTMLSPCSIDGSIEVEPEWSKLEGPARTTESYVLKHERKQGQIFQVCVNDFHFILLVPTDTSSQTSNLFPNLFLSFLLRMLGTVRKVEKMERKVHMTGTIFTFPLPFDLCYICMYEMHWGFK